MQCQLEETIYVKCAYIIKWLIIYNDNCNDNYNNNNSDNKNDNNNDNRNSSNNNNDNNDNTDDSSKFYLYANIYV